MQSREGSANSRWGRIAMVVAVWVFFGGIFGLQWNGDREIWHRLFAVQPMAQPFADLGQVAAAVSTYQHGLDPYLNNRYDLDKRRFIYPRVWIYLFAALRITPERSFVAGVLMACCFLATMSWLIARQQDPWASLFIALAACSGGAALAVERGNTDILILCLVVLASELESRGGVWLLLTASVLKVYPFFALLAEAVMGRRKTRLVFLAMALAAAGILAQHGDFSRQQSSIPHGYGLKEIDIAMQRAPASLREVFEAHLLAFHVLWASVLAALAGSGAVAGFRRGMRRPPIEHDGGIYIHARGTNVEARGTYIFVLCTSIFAGTFLVGTSFDYRLIFLIPLIPFLTGEARRGSTRLERTLGTVALCLILLGMNRGATRLVSSPLGTALFKTASHADLWALLWTVCFFVGLLCATYRRAMTDDNRSDSQDEVGDRLVKEPA